MRWWLAAMVTCAALSSGSIASAQQPAAGRVTIAGGVRAMMPTSIDEVAAAETTAGGSSRTIFNTKTTLNGSIGGMVSVGVRVSPKFVVEGGTSFNATHLTTRVTDDVEQATDTSATERVTQILAEGGVLVMPWKGRPSSRLSPFVIAGLGYVRHLNEGRTLVENGRELYVGAGLYYERASARESRLKSTGVRLDARATVLQGAIASGTGGHVAAAMTAAVFVRF